MKIKRWEAALIAAVVISAAVGAVSAVRDQKELSEKLIRLHVTANSDSEMDQAVKLMVRDAVLDEIGPLLEDVHDRKTAEMIISSDLDKIKQVSAKTVQNAGKDWPIAVSLAEETFPTRRYDTFSLPAGRYTSLRVTLGNGEGKNWWCVVFPPVCSTTLDEDSAAAVNITPDELDLITMDSGKYVIKFKTIELIEKLRSELSRLLYGPK